MTKFVIPLLLSTTLLADPHWIHLRSTHFEMYSTAGDKDARESLRYFEQARGFFVQAMSAPKNELPVVIVAFASRKEYEPYRLNQFATAFYHGTSTRDFIVLSHAGAESFPTATHEYVHLFVRHAGLKLPPWLGEGLAEFYSTLKPYAGKILVGGLVEGRRQALLRDPWVPLPVILAAGRDSPYYNEKDKAGSLYNEGWALTHMLILSPAYRAGFQKALAGIVAGLPSEAVLTEAYGKSIAQIEKDLQAYLRGDRFQGALFEQHLDKADDEIPVEPAPPFDVHLTLAQLLDRPGHDDAARKGYQALIAEDPKRPEPFVALGFLDSRRRDTESAREDFAKAYALGSREPEMLWHYGVLIQRGNMPESIAALSELLRQQPDRTEARIVLAFVQLSSHLPADAVKTLAPVHKVTAEEAPRFFTVLAHSQEQSGDLKSARDSAHRLLEVARTDGERDDAQRLLDYLDAISAPNPAASAPQSARRELPSLQDLVKPVPMLKLHGSFVSLDCSGAQPRVVVSADGKTRIFLIDNADLINLGQGGMELTCGPRSPVAVDIGYFAPDADHPGVDGLLREFHLAK